MNDLDTSSTDILDEVDEKEKTQPLTDLEVRLSARVSNLRFRNASLHYLLRRCERECLSMADEIERLRRIKQ
jgi:hypothetical protein